MSVEDKLKKVVALCEANDNEAHQLWTQWSTQSDCNSKWRPAVDHRLKWGPQLDGWLFTVGLDNRRPVCISLSIKQVGKKLIAFWHPTSMIVNHKKIKAWLEENLPNVEKSEDANNFHILAHFLRDEPLKVLGPAPAEEEIRPPG